MSYPQKTLVINNFVYNRIYGFIKAKNAVDCSKRCLSLTSLLGITGSKSLHTKLVTLKLNIQRRALAPSSVCSSKKEEGYAAEGENPSSSFLSLNN